MLFSNAFLAECEQLPRESFPLLLKPGGFVGRGFADIGFELFSVLPGEKLLSLMTGARTQPTEPERQHLFPVPLVDDLLRTVTEQGGEGIQLENRQGWTVEASFSDEKVSAEAESLHLALIRLFLTRESGA